MKLGIVCEQEVREDRVALLPSFVNSYKDLGLEVIVESGAGKPVYAKDDDYASAGATILSSAEDVFKTCDVVLKVHPLLIDKKRKINEFSYLKKKQILIGKFDFHNNETSLDDLQKKGVTAIALERMPRITRAQSMDILSSQANIGGYKAVLDAAHYFRKSMPMMMTAAGTLLPAKVFIIGAGVAGLQAIATARRLGAVVSAYDVRLAAKEQVESLGAKFVSPQLNQDFAAESGYAKEMDESAIFEQQKFLRDFVPTQDILITTAMIPGKKAPLIIDEDTAMSMQPGSVIIDMAVEEGGNVAQSRKGTVIQRNGITFVGHSNYPSRLSLSASQALSKNYFEFVKTFFNKETSQFNFNDEDEILDEVIVIKEGKLWAPSFKK